GPDTNGGRRARAKGGRDKRGPGIIRRTWLPDRSRGNGRMPVFTQTLVPLGSLWLTVLVAFVPLFVLLFLLAGLRITAWQATLVAGVVTALIGIFVWGAPTGPM